MGYANLCAHKLAQGDQALSLTGFGVALTKRRDGPNLILTKESGGGPDLRARNSAFGKGREDDE